MIGGIGGTPAARRRGDRPLLLLRRQLLRFERGEAGTFLRAARACWQERGGDNHAARSQNGGRARFCCKQFGHSAPLFTARCSRLASTAARRNCLCEPPAIAYYSSGAREPGHREAAGA